MLMMVEQKEQFLCRNFFPHLRDTDGYLLDRVDEFEPYAEVRTRIAEVLLFSGHHLVGQLPHELFRKDLLEDVMFRRFHMQDLEDCLSGFRALVLIWAALDIKVRDRSYAGIASDYVREAMITSLGPFISAPPNWRLGMHHEQVAWLKQVEKEADELRDRLLTNSRAREIAERADKADRERGTHRGADICHSLEDEFAENDDLSRRFIEVFRDPTPLIELAINEPKLLQVLRKVDPVKFA